MSDEEDDYMSDKLLASLTDVRPGLILDHAKKRQVHVEEQKAEQMKRQQLERYETTEAGRNERLQESLQRPIEQDNKGFQLLAKMGYKAGESLGKTKPDGTRAGIQEPIGINLKLNRGGLGREAAATELTQKRKQVDGVALDQYRKRAISRGELRYLIIILRKCKEICENLDIKFGKMSKPSVDWYWPIRSCVLENSENTDSESEEDGCNYREKVDLITYYMRKTYMYCFWCGERYKNMEDMEAHCPGPEKDDH